MGKEPGACFRSVPAAGIGLQYPRLEGARATPLSSSTAERWVCSSGGRGGDGGRGGMGRSPCRISRSVSLEMHAKFHEIIKPTKMDASDVTKFIMDEMRLQGQKCSSTRY